MNRRNLTETAPLLALVALMTVAYLLVRLAAPPLSPQLVDQCGNGNGIESAPIVIVGVLTSDTLVRQPVPMHSDPTYPLQLRQLTVSVENMLKGPQVPAEIIVYYFTWAGSFDGPRPLGFWRAGGQRILALRTDSGVLRTACDGWDYCTRDLSSGAHPNYAPDPRKSLDYALTDLLLTRGEGVVNEIGFATQLDWEPTEPRLAAYAIQKLRHLAQAEQGEIKSSACETLWIYTVDRIDPSLRESASDALRASNCQCITKRDGKVTCR